MNRAKLNGQIRHFLTSGGWLLFLLVFLPGEWWDRAADNVKKMGTIIGALGGVAALAGHYWSAKDKDGDGKPDNE